MTTMVMEQKKRFSVSIPVTLPDETETNWQQWDAQIERDSAAGKLDRLAERALSAVSRAI